MPASAAHIQTRIHAHLIVRGGVDTTSAFYAVRRAPCAGSYFLLKLSTQVGPASQLRHIQTVGVQGTLAYVDASVWGKAKRLLAAYMRNDGQGTRHSCCQTGNSTCHTHPMDRDRVEWLPTHSPHPINQSNICRSTAYTAHHQRKQRCDLPALAYGILTPTANQRPTSHPLVPLAHSL